MNNDERTWGSPDEGTTPAPIITHDDGDVITLPGPDDEAVEAPKGEFDDDGLLAQQTPGLDPAKVRDLRDAGNPE